MDDDPDDHLLFSQALEEVDPSVVYLSAENGADAIQKLESGKIPLPDLIFMDVNMPRMNGLECLIALQHSQKFKLVPVIMYSTSCSLVFQKACFQSGAIHYIQKATDYNELCLSLQTILSKGLPLVKTVTPEL